LKGSNVPLSQHLASRLGPLLQRRSAVTLVELQAQAKLIESYMRAHHPWKNQTGEAERQLFASVTVRAIGTGVEVFELSAGQGVAYGAALEESRGGMYAIVRPTMQRYSKLIMPSLIKKRVATR
jgi:hypothetical protein